MFMDRILFANIGWMVHYNGLSAGDSITGGGSFQDEGKLEVFNFQNLEGWCYGYVQTVRFGQVNLQRIYADCDNSSDRLEDVLVVWTARRPDSGGTYIVGWYKHAIVYKDYQDSNSVERNRYKYNIKAKASDCTLLNVDHRTLAVPRAHSQDGGMGQSNVWYADKDIPEIKKFRNDVIDYVDSSTPRPIFHKPFAVNAEAKKLVEEAAVNKVRETYEECGFIVRSVEKENLGWDLDVRKDNIYLRIEVKGLVGNVLSIHITPNEYSKMKAKDNANYRLCVVINALTHPELYTFIFDRDAWVCEEDPNLILNIDEQVAAIAYL